MGQFRAQLVCPICGEDNGASKWTCSSCTTIVDVHRSLLRNLQQWKSMYEAMEADETLTGNDGRAYSLWDVQVFYGHRISLPDKQSLAIQYCLFENMKEKDAAVRMGIKASNPVSIYATIGLTSLLTRAITFTLPGYFVEIREPAITQELVCP